MDLTKAVCRLAYGLAAAPPDSIRAYSRLVTSKLEAWANTRVTLDSDMCEPRRLPRANEVIDMPRGL
jgi:hypothetical protein